MTRTSKPPGARSSTAQRLIDRMRAEGVELPDGARLARTCASRAARSEGAWSWFALGPDGRELGIGSQWPMAELLRAPAWVMGPDRHGRYAGGDLCIDPAPDA